MKHRIAIVALGSLVLLWLVMGVTAQENTEPTPSPTGVLPTATITPGGPTLTPTPIQLDPLLSIGIEPPMDITLPDEWLFGYDTLAYRDIDGSIQTALIAVYTGPVTEGTGWLILIWGHNSVVNPFEMESPERAAFLDGLRLLRLVIFDPTCDVEVEPQTEYSVGQEPAQGAEFTALNCPEEQPDTSGWFAALTQEGMNFAFYAYVDPMQDTDAPGMAEVQTILDSINFRLEEVTFSQEEFEATRAAILTQTPSAEATAEATEAP
jgi:hypothetical protein